MIEVHLLTLVCDRLEMDQSINGFFRLFVPYVKQLSERTATWTALKRKYNANVRLPRGTSWKLLELDYPKHPEYDFSFLFLCTGDIMSSIIISLVILEMVLYWLKFGKHSKLCRLLRCYKGQYCWEAYYVQSFMVWQDDIPVWVEHNAEVFLHLCRLVHSFDGHRSTGRLVLKWLMPNFIWLSGVQLWNPIPMSFCNPGISGMKKSTPGNSIPKIPKRERKY